MCRAFEVMGCDPPGLRIHCENVIPHGRGMGSSSAAIVAGICAARGVVAGGSLLMDDDAVLTLATSLEGHPDNVAPAFLGGFTIAWQSGEEVLATGVTVDPRIHVVVFVPPDPVETTVARGLLPASVSHADAAANSARAALLVAALSRQPELLFDGTEDLLHQHYRESAMPHTLGLVRALRAARVPATVSGAGPSVLAFADASQQESLAARAPAGWQALALSVDRRGTLVDLGGGVPGRNTRRRADVLRDVEISTTEGARLVPRPWSVTTLVREGCTFFSSNSLSRAFCRCMPPVRREPDQENHSEQGHRRTPVRPRRGKDLT
jgi:homoserine kinase